MADKRYGYVLVPVVIDTFDKELTDDWLSQAARAGALDLEGPLVSSYLSEDGGAFGFTEASNIYDAMATLRRVDID